MNLHLTRSKATLLFTLGVSLCRAELPPATLLATVESHQDSVLFLSGTIKFLCGRCTQEHEFQVVSTAVVADAKGLLLAATAGPLADPATEIRASTLQVRMPDGAEVPVRIALTDEDLGVVVLAVEKPEDAKTHPFKPLKLEAPPRARLLDHLIVLRRHDQGTGYAVSGATVRVNAIETRPRVMYFSAGVSSGQAVSPCFDAQGRLVALATGSEGAIASDELEDLVSQARSRLSK